MKKCPECRREIDKYGIACEYCGKVEEARKKVNQPTRLKKQNRGIINKR